MVSVMSDVIVPFLLFTQNTPFRRLSLGQIFGVVPNFRYYFRDYCSQLHTYCTYVQ